MRPTRVRRTTRGRGRLQRRGGRLQRMRGLEEAAEEEWPATEDEGLGGGCRGGVAGYRG